MEDFPSARLDSTGFQHLQLSRYTESKKRSTHQIVTRRSAGSSTHFTHSSSNHDLRLLHPVLVHSREERGNPSMFCLTSAIAVPILLEIGGAIKSVNLLVPFVHKYQICNPHMAFFFNCGIRDPENWTLLIFSVRKFCPMQGKRH